METNDRKARVLIVDDDPALCRLLKFGLDRAGYETLTAADGAQAMALLGPQRVDLIIVDLMMPVIDGLRFLRWLRQEAKLDVPALAFTSYDKNNAPGQALTLGATEVAVKPVKLPQLLETVTRLLGRGKG